MYLLSAVLATLAGLAITTRIGGTKNVLERVGLSILIGSGVVTVAMFVPHVFGAPIRPWVYLSITGFVAFDGLWCVRKRGALSGAVPLRRLTKPEHPILGAGLAAVLVMLFTVIAGRMALFPNRFRDSLTSFDLLARVMADEGRFRVSILDFVTVRGVIYTPHAAATFTWGYQCGLGDASLSLIFPLAGFIAWLFGYARRHFGATASYGFLALCFTSPDLYSFVHFPLTNGYVAMYGAVALFYAFEATRGGGREAWLAWIGALLAVWTRAEAVAFALAAFVVMVAAGRALRPRWLPYALLGSAVLLVFAWNRYTEHLIGTGGTDRLIMRPFWDAHRLKMVLVGGAAILGSETTMGYVTWVAVAALASYGVMRRGGALRLWAGILVSLAAYTLFFYQTDPHAQDTLASLLQSSYRRGIIAFVAPMWLAVLWSPLGALARRAVGSAFAAR